MKPFNICALLVTAAALDLAPGHQAAADELDDFMRAKLVHSQDVVEGLVPRRLRQNRQGRPGNEPAESGRDMASPANCAVPRVQQEVPQIGRCPERSRAKKNLDQAAKEYNVVLQRCVECHKYLRNMPPSPGSTNRDRSPHHGWPSLSPNEGRGVRPVALLFGDER